MLKMLEKEIESFRDRIREVRVTPSLSRSALVEHLVETYDFQDPIPDEELFEDVVRLLRDGSVHVTHPRYFGLFNPSVTEPSIVGDALAALYNPQLAAWSHAPAMNEMERHLLGFFASCLGFDREKTHANFATGGAEANQSAVIVALASRLENFVSNGVAGRRPRVYVSEESHHSFHKTVVMCGLGTDTIRTIPVDSSFRMDVDELESALHQDRIDGYVPLVVVGTAGTTSSGTIESLDEIGRVASDYGAWFHVDAAWGGSYLLVPELRNHFEGIEAADSVTWDAHKGLSVPMGAGMFFCRHPEAVSRAFDVRTAYMPQKEGEAVDPYASTVQWTRRAIGLKVFLSIGSLGARGYEAMLRRQTSMGDRIRRGVIERGWKVVNDTPLPVVCFTHPRLVGRQDYSDAAAAVQARGRTWISHTVLGGSIPVLRACVTSFETTEEDVNALLGDLGELGLGDHDS